VTLASSKGITSEISLIKGQRPMLEMGGVKGKGLQTIELVEQTLGKPSALNGVARRVSMRRRVRA
jgi:hypothetical protein